MRVSDLSMNSLNFYIAKLKGMSVKSRLLGDDDLRTNKNRWWVSSSDSIRDIPEITGGDILDLIIAHKINIRREEGRIIASMLVVDPNDPSGVTALWVDQDSSRLEHAVKQVLVKAHYGDDLPQA
jgi:hypothetical protein